MIKLVKHYWGIALAMAVIALLPTQVQAQVCGLQTVSGGSVSATYDPFNGTTTSINNTTLILRRINPVGGKNTTTMNFYFYSDVTGLNGIELNGQSIAQSGGSGSGALGATGSNLYWSSNESPPILTNTASPPARTAYWDFAGNAANNDNFALNLNIVLPTNLNLTAGTSIPFNIRYSCVIGSGANAQTETGTKSGALILNIAVKSGLQAFYAGPALDFGEIGTTTTATVTGAPATYSRTGNINVRSSGPYSVAMTSANAYRMTFPGGSLANANQRLDYTAQFLGQIRSNASPTFTTTTCVRAGLPAYTSLPLKVTLQEGGTAKTAAPVYSDTLTVTVTPLAATPAPGGQQACPTL